jgi:hypothetical protein
MSAFYVGCGVSVVPSSVAREARGHCCPPQVCHRCRRMHVRGSGEWPVVVTVCPKCDRSRPAPT